MIALACVCASFVHYRVKYTDSQLLLPLCNIIVAAVIKVLQLLAFNMFLPPFLVAKTCLRLRKVKSCNCAHGRALLHTKAELFHPEFTPTISIIIWWVVKGCIKSHLTFEWLWSYIIFSRGGAPFSKRKQRKTCFHFLKPSLVLLAHFPVVPKIAIIILIQRTCWQIFYTQGTSCFLQLEVFTFEF